MIFHPEVYEELEEATEFIRADKKKSAEEFADEVEKTLASIGRKPSAGSPGVMGTRRKLVWGFHYTIIYRIHFDHVFIIAVTHERRDPDYWHYRL